MPRFLLLLFLFACVAGAAELSLLYTQDFNSSVGGEWSSASTATLPADASRRVLGLFGNNTVNLSLGTAIPHNSLKISFDLYMNASTDGTGASYPTGGTDFSVAEYWSLQAGGLVLLNTTFSSHRYQSYPYNYDSNNLQASAPRTGAAEVFSNNDTRYRLEFTFDHTASNVQFAFSGSNWQSLADESWALDNVTVWYEPIPEPGTFFLYALSLLAISHLFFLSKKA